MLRKQDGLGSIRRLDCYFRLLPEHVDWSTLFCCPRFYCYVFAYIAFYTCVIASCLKHSNKTIVKSNVSKQMAITHSETKTMLSKQDGPGAIGVVLIVTFRSLPEHQVCSTFVSEVLLLCVC